MKESNYEFYVISEFRNKRKFLVLKGMSIKLRELSLWVKIKKRSKDLIYIYTCLALYLDKIVSIPKNKKESFFFWFSIAVEFGE